MLYPLLYNKGKRANNSKNKVKEELIDFLKEEAKKNHFPSRRELESKFHLRLGYSIKNLYKSADIKYIISRSQHIKSLKATKLLRLIIKNLDKFGLRLICYRNVHERGIDILARQNNKLVGIEIKAYNKFEKLKQRNINQVERFIKNEKLDRAIIIFTSDFSERIKRNASIELINYKDLIRIIPENKTLKFIRNHSVNLIDDSKQKIRQRILTYVLNKYTKEKIKPNSIEINKDLKLSIYSYFPSLFEIYKILKIPPPLWRMNGKRAKTKDIECINLWKDAFKGYIIDKVRTENRYPSGYEISKNFNVYVWNIVRMSELYEELGLEPYLERKKRTTFLQDS